MKKLIKILSIIIFIPVILIIGVFCFLKFADLNGYKPEIEKIIKKYANVEIKINGNLDVGISLKPSIELNDVDVSNPQNGTKIARIGNALVQFSIMPLLHKEIVINTVQTENTAIFYGQNDTVIINDINLNMEGYDTPINIAFDTTISGIDIFGNAKISSLKSLQQNNFSATDLETAVNALGYKLIFNGALSNIQAKLAAAGKYELKYLSNILKGGVSFNLTETVPSIKMDIMSDVLNVAEFTAKKQAVNMVFINTAFAEEYIANTQIPYKYLQMANADITFDLAKIIVNPDIVLTNAKGEAHLLNGVFKSQIKNINFQNNTIDGAMEITSAKSLPYVKLNIKGEGLDLPKLQKATTVKKANITFFTDAYAFALMPNTEIPYKYLQMANADVNINWQKLVLNPDITLQKINTLATIKNSVLNAKINNITAGDGTIKGTLTLNGQKKSLVAQINGDNIILQKLYKPFATENKSFYIKQGGVTNFKINVDTFGRNTDQYLSNLSGQIISYIDPSILKIKSLEKLQGNIIVQILNALKMNVSNKDMNLSCAVVRGDISNGLIQFPKGIAVDAKDFYLVANGKINLQNDKINLELQPFSGKITDVNISSIIGNLLKITGTISHPSIGINQTETAKNVIGAIASGGAYNVGDLMLSADASPCRTALKGTAFAEHFKASSSVSSSVNQGYTNTKDTIKGIGKDIKNQAKDLKNQFKGLFK